MTTSSEIKAMAFEAGADLCGIAPVGRFFSAPEGYHPFNIYPKTRSVLVIAKREPESVLYSTSAVAYTFATEVIRNDVYRITLDLVMKLEKKGITAIPIPSGFYAFWDEERTTGMGILSLRHAGQLAGLGVIGKNTLLQNKNFGNLIKLGAILTNIELDGDPLDDRSVCKDSCSLCIKSCPMGAINEGYVDQFKCRKKSNVKTKKGNTLEACNICRKVCPHRAGNNRLTDEIPLMVSSLLKVKNLLG